jgi:hypothetical protein
MIKQPPIKNPKSTTFVSALNQCALHYTALHCTALHCSFSPGQAATLLIPGSLHESVLPVALRRVQGGAQAVGPIIDSNMFKVGKQGRAIAADAVLPPVYD